VSAGTEVKETYLIFTRRQHSHSAIFFVQSSSVNEAVWHYMHKQINDSMRLNEDGSVQEYNHRYPHVLAYIEANEKITGEWQIRKIPEWVWQEQVVEAFCGESEDGPAYVIKECRPYFTQAFPSSRAKAFVWYLNQGTLVTFYHKTGAFQIKILKRYLWKWDGEQTRIEEWTGGYNEIATSLLLEPYLL
jgi:hypothetical protein